MHLKAVRWLNSKKKKEKKSNIGRLVPNPSKKRHFQALLLFQKARLLGKTALAQILFGKHSEFLHA